MSRALLRIAFLSSLVGGCGDIAATSPDGSSSVDLHAQVGCHGRADCGSGEQCCVRASDTIDGTVAETTCLVAGSCAIESTVDTRQSYTCSSDSDCADASGDGGALVCCPATRFAFSGQVCLPHC